jgi:uncharacterized protein
MDARKFAQQSVELQGQILQSDLPRLSHAVNCIETAVIAKLRFAVDESGYCTVTGPLHVRVSVDCQRCMRETELELASELNLGVVASDAESKLLPRSLEPWLVSEEEAEADLYAVVEDELLLDLPMVVYHDYQCIDEKLYSAGDTSTVAPPEDNHNPFQVLEQLKGDKK